MERHNHEQNLAHCRRLVAESKRDPLRNEAQLDWLLKLLADEEAEDSQSPDGTDLFALAAVVACNLSSRITVTVHLID